MRIYRLDGLRALAILMVVIFHSGHFNIWFGSSGVDLFFVLSGYFITGILRRTRTTENYWSRFYIRRAARILPPVILLMVAYTFATKRVEIVTVLGYGLFAGNILQMTTRFGSAVLSPLWSLAVEEHFYLLWPMVVLLFNRRTLLVILSAVLLAEPIIRAIATPHLATYAPIYFLTPFRLDGLAAGSLLALLTEGDAELPRQRGYGLLALTMAPGLLLCTVANRNANTIAYNSLSYSFYAVLYFCVLAWVLTLDRGFFYSLLSSKPIAYLGRISYGVYLFHIPVAQISFRLLRRDPFPLDFLLTLVVASLSYRFVERPIMRFAQTESIAALPRVLQRSCAEE